MNNSSGGLTLSSNTVSFLSININDKVVTPTGGTWRYVGIVIYESGGTNAITYISGTSAGNTVVFNTQTLSVYSLAVRIS